MTEREKRSKEPSSHRSKRSCRLVDARINAKSTTASTPPRTPQKAAFSYGKTMRHDTLWPQSSSSSDTNHPSRATSMNQLANGKSKAVSEGPVKPVSDEQQYGAHRRIQELERALAAAQARQKKLTLEMERLRALSASRPRPSSTVPSIFHEPTAMPRAGSGHEDDEEGAVDLMMESNRQCSMMEDRLVFQKQIVQLRDQIYEQQQELLAKEKTHERKSEEWKAEREGLLKDLNDARAYAKERDEQVLGLKRVLSTSTRTQNQVSDAELADRMEQLYHESREWIVSNYRRSTLELDYLPDDVRALRDELIPRYKSLPDGAKLCAYQAFLTHHQMAIFKEKGLFGFPSTGALAHIKGTLNYFSDDDQQQQQHQQIRTTLLTALHAQSNTDLQLHHHTSLAVHDLIERTIKTLHAISSTEPSAESKASLRAILEHTNAITGLLARQSDVYSVERPDVTVREKAGFDAGCMIVACAVGSARDGNGDGDDEVEVEGAGKEGVEKGKKVVDMTVECAVAPMLLKSEKETQEMKVVAKAKVVCSAEVA